MLIVFQKLYVICVVSKPKLYTILHILFCARIYVYWFVYVPLKKMPSHGIMLSALPYIHIYTRQNLLGRRTVKMNKVFLLSFTFVSLV